VDELALATVRAEFPNFRDLGGLPTTSGRQMRPGVVFRAQAPTGISAEAVAALDTLGVRNLVDLRMPHERAEFAVALPPQFLIVVADVMEGHGDSVAAAAGAAREESKPIESPAGGGKDRMMETYRSFVSLASAQAAYASFLRSVLRGEGATAVYCAAGKDRTGWAAAIVQTFAGIDRSTAISSYVESNVNLVGRYQRRLADAQESGADMEALRALIDAHPDYLMAAFERMDAQYGDIEGYLRQGLGMTADELTALQARLVQ